jgi:tRNA(Ile)-lysidine synthase
VARRAKILGLPFVTERISARAEMRRRRLSGENGLRVLRREFLIRAAHDSKADTIALAHTADDQAETVLLRLVRGTGIAGLGAMRWRRGRWIRPLLGVTREQVWEFLRERRIRPRQDPSNLDRRHSRNRIRLDVLPVLRQLNPQVSLTLAAAAERFQDLSSLLDRAGKRALRQALAGDSSGRFRLVRKSLLGYHPAIRENVIRQAWKSENPGSGGLTRRHLRAIEELLISGVGRSRVNLPDKRVARLERGHLFFTPNSRPRPGLTSTSTGPVRKRNRR